MTPKEEQDNTTNRYVYNRRYKQLNAGCSYCKWHRVENASACKTYGKQKKKRIRDYKKVVISNE